MQTVTTQEALRLPIDQWKAQNQSIGFVPTMGNLHQGHLALVEAADRANDKTVVSIFVNPTQFSPGEDYHLYPRNHDADAAQLQQRGVDLLFLPTVNTMYGDDPDAIVVSSPKLSNMLCGPFRPNHFDGVATIISKLFNMVRPDEAFFGEKDYQQLVLIRQLTEQLSFPVKIIACPTQRDPDGLAMSSRNQYLSADERQIAGKLQAILSQAVRHIRSGDRDFSKITQAAIIQLDQLGFSTQYVEIRRQNDLKIAKKGDNMLIILAAAQLGKTRLIDNIQFELS